MAQTCIIKYSKNDPFYFIMYPSSKYFDVVLSDMDLTTLTAKQVSQKNKAAKLSSNGLTIDNYTYPPNISEGDFVHHIVSHNRQSQPNGLIIKFVKFTDNNQINYAVSTLILISLTRRKLSWVNLTRLSIQELYIHI